MSQRAQAAWEGLRYFILDDGEDGPIHPKVGETEGQARVCFWHAKGSVSELGDRLRIVVRRRQR